jgi:hypothetical protein
LRIPEFSINEAKEIGEECISKHLNTLPGFPSPGLGIELNRGGTEFFSKTATSTYEKMNNHLSLLITIIQPLRSLKH